MKMSVIIPVYNVEEFLPKCLDSVINQSYQNIEIVIINDQTPDKSQKIIDSYKSNDDRIVSVIHEKNKGLGGARNTGISVATGDYISFLDSDDWLELDAFEVLAKEIEKNHAEIIKFGYQEVFGDRELKSSVLSPKVFANGWDEIKDALSHNRYTPMCVRSIYLREFIFSNGLSFPEKTLFEDFSFTFQAHILTTKISSVPNYFYNYRQGREGSIMFKINERDIEVCDTLAIISDFMDNEDYNAISTSIEYKFLMHEWSAGTTIYRHLKTKGDKALKRKVILEIRNNPYFIKYLDLIIEDKRVGFVKKLPVRLLRNSLPLFKLIYSLFLRLRR